MRNEFVKYHAPKRLLTSCERQAQIEHVHQPRSQLQVSSPSVHHSTPPVCVRRSKGPPSGSRVDSVREHMNGHYHGVI